MKYLKRFNEELKPQTYRNAARKLDKLGFSSRSKDLKDWADKREGEENIVKWSKELESYSKYGLFNLNIENPETGETISGSFALDITFDEDAFEDSIESAMSEGEVNSEYFTFFIGIIPTTKELIEECERIMPEADMGNGFYWGLIMSVKFEIKSGSVNLLEFKLENYDESLSGNVTFSDRPSAQRFKNLMKKILTDRNFDYPSGYTNADTLYEVLERSILVRQSFSNEYGFELDQLADFINKISPNDINKMR